MSIVFFAALCALGAFAVAVAQSQSRPSANTSATEKRHRVMIALCVAVLSSVVIWVLARGWDYYLLGQMQRPFSPKHAELRPSGTVGLRLGFLGLFLFGLVYLYPLRKHWRWLSKKGKTRHWLDYHIVLGLVAPAVISLHSSFKFQGFAGMAYWTMLALTGSGIVGRYLYAQVPKSLGAAEMSLKELGDFSSQLSSKLHAQNVLPVPQAELLFRLPSKEKVARMPIIVALLWMMALDVVRPFRIWKLRRNAPGAGSRWRTLGGVLRTRNAELEKAIAMARKQTGLSKKILFLARTERVFHLWHVVHRPFSYTFAILVIIHISVVMLLGYF